MKRALPLALVASLTLPTLVQDWPADLGDGTGITNLPSASGSIVVQGVSQTATANRSYLLTNDVLTTVTLPASPKLGDIVTVSGTGAAGWRVEGNAGQVAEVFQ